MMIDSLMPDESPNILDRLQIVPIEKSELPVGFRSVSIALSLHSDHVIISTMWETLKGTALVTRKGDRIVFWRGAADEGEFERRSVEVPL